MERSPLLAGWHSVRLFRSASLLPKETRPLILAVRAFPAPAVPAWSRSCPIRQPIQWRREPRKKLFKLVYFSTSGCVCAVYFLFPRSVSQLMMENRKRNLSDKSGARDTRCHWERIIRCVRYTYGHQWGQMEQQQQPPYFLDQTSSLCNIHINTDSRTDSR